MTGNYVLYIRATNNPSGPSDEFVIRERLCGLTYDEVKLIISTITATLRSNFYAVYDVTNTSLTARRLCSNDYILTLNAVPYGNP